MKDGEKMEDKMTKGLHLLTALGGIIHDEGEENHGNIGIWDLDYATFKLIQNILDYMNVNDVEHPPYQLQYNDEFYQTQTDFQNYNLYNAYTTGIILFKKEIEKHTTEQ